MMYSTYQDRQKKNRINKSTKRKIPKKYKKNDVMNLFDKKRYIIYDIRKYYDKVSFSMFKRHLHLNPKCGLILRIPMCTYIHAR
ncbi:hypothetical protein C922_02710 [Plasmodium inui San Antonio 1]|uniref:Uncharacterized protein n=1 Tax=Plasmodium inui San Antonio 1 TaxID=1237626 RepID=W7A4Q8_9APIC|nr:hypothetical protein C922_02710 [Plasmodium inui San Antonio 1]EUD66725.1 hypothetical protein C922_02710 [Plasmodium inui San Antonio 1]